MVVVACRRLLFARGSNCKALTGKIIFLFANGKVNFELILYNKKVQEKFVKAVCMVIFPLYETMNW